MLLRLRQLPCFHTAFPTSGHSAFGGLAPSKQIPTIQLTCPTLNLEEYSHLGCRRAAKRSFEDAAGSPGIEVPVARSRIATLREEGWLPPATELPSGRAIPGSGL